jgi:hypothetical protein
VPDIRSIVDEIRFYLESNEAEMTEAVRQTAKDYAGVCRDTNFRLRRCGEFLNRNLRAEAIQFAEADPDLLEVVSTLDFAGREKWDQVVSMYSLTPVEPLLMEIAEALNEAYALQEPVKKLLDKHRFLALMRAPIKQRLAVLWKLVEQDPTLGTWETDACEMERVRLREIESEARDAVKRSDAQRLQSIAAELAEGKWIEKIPQNLKTAVQESSRKLTRVDARGRVEELVARMEAALADGNLVNARKLKAEWNELQRAAGLDGFDPISQRASPMLQWIAEEDTKYEARQKWEKAEASFRNVLDDEQAERSELERARAALARIDGAMPPPLEQRFHDRVSRIERSEKRRKLAVIAGALAAAIAVALVTGLLIRMALRNAEATRLAQSVSQLVKDDKLAEARQVADEHHDLAGAGRWDAAIKELTDAEKRETDRVAQFSALTISIRDAQSYDDALSQLDRMGQLAKTDDEKATIDSRRAEWEGQHKKDLQAKTKSIQDKIDAVTDALGRAKKMRDQAPRTGDLSTLLSDLSALLPEIAGRLTTLSKETGGPASEYGARVKLFENELKGLQDFVSMENQKGSAIETIRKGSVIRPTEAGSVKLVDDYIAALADFTKSFPDDPRKDDFQEVRKEAPVYRAICAWQYLLGQWKTLMPADVDEVRKRVTQCSEFLTKYPTSPVTPVAKQYSDFVQAMARREELATKLNKVFGGELMENVHFFVEKKDDSIYYVKGPVDFSGKEFANIHYLCGFQNETKVKTIRTSDLKTGVSTPAAQSALSTKALDKLAKLSLANWEATIGQLSQFVLDTQGLDEFLKYALLRYVLEYGASGSELLNADLQKPQSLLRRGPDLSMRWMVPKDVSAKNARSSAGQLVARITDLDKVWPLAEEKRQQLGKAVFCRCQFIGTLAHGMDGQWRCATQWTPEGNYELLVPMPGPNDGPYQLESIGSVKNGRLEIAQEGRSTVLHEGQLVVARAPAAEAVAASGAPGSSETSK